MSVKQWRIDNIEQKKTQQKMEQKKSLFFKQGVLDHQETMRFLREKHRLKDIEKITIIRRTKSKRQQRIKQLVLNCKERDEKTTNLLNVSEKKEKARDVAYRKRAINQIENIICSSGGYYDFYENQYLLRNQ